MPSPDPLNTGVSATTIPDAELSEMERLFRRGRVGCCRMRMHRGKYFEVDASYPGGIKLARARRYFSSVTAAVRWAREVTQEIREHGRMARELSSGWRWVAAECRRKLGKIGPDDPAELLRVVDAHLKLHPLGGNVRLLDDVRKEVVALKTKTGRSERHVKGLDYKLRCLVSAIGNKVFTTITTMDLEEELERHPDWKPTTVHSAVQSWKILFNFGVKRGYLNANPADKIDLPKIIHDEPEILSLSDARRLLAATLFRDRDPRLPDCQLFLAIGMFSGLRPDEIGRLDWRHVSLETATIRVKEANAKDRDRRIVDISPNLAAWLTPHAKPQGPVLPCRLDTARAAARGVLGLDAWPTDILRHTFASYHFAQHRNEAATKHQMGHRDDGRIFYNHYCVPVSRPEAAQFWAIRPPVAFLEDRAA